MCKILWLDNDADQLAPYAEHLLGFDLHVDLISSPEEAINLLGDENSPYECLLLDLKFYRVSEYPSDVKLIRSGFDFLERMVSSNILTPVCILSSYLQIDDYEEKLADFGENKAIRGIAIDKFVGDVNSAVFKGNFVDKIVNFVSKVENSGVDGGIDTNSKLQKQPKNPFAIRYETYLAMSKRQQAEVRGVAREKIEKSLSKLAESGAVWALYIGASSEPNMVVNRIDDIPTNQSISVMGLERDRIPFQFRVNTIIEDQWAGCGADINMASYPKIELRSRGGIVDAEWRVHFDTGSLESYFSLEEFIDIGMFGNFADLIDDKYRGRRFSYRREAISFRVSNEESGETLTVKAFVNLIEDWGGSPFVARCAAGCTKGTRLFLGGPRTCVNRPGLMGRSLLIQNQLKVEYDPGAPVLKVSKSAL